MSQQTPFTKPKITAAKLIETRGHYPVWSVKSIAWLGLGTLVLTLAIVAAVGRQSLIVELEWTLSIVSAALFLMLLIGLYRGVRLREGDQPALGLDKGEIADWIPDGNSMPDLSSAIDGFDVGDDGCLGAIVGFLLSIVVMLVLVGLLWLFLQVAAIVLFVVVAAIYWILHLALRQVFAHSPDCHGNLARSLGYASLYTLLYTGWLFVLLLLIARITQPAA